MDLSIIGTERYRSTPHWISRRARCRAFGDTVDDTDEKKLALYIRYQTTHERAYYRALNELLKLRKERQKVEFGFESQNRRAAEETRRQELHSFKAKIAKTDADERFITFWMYKNREIRDAREKQLAQEALEHIQVEQEARQARKEQKIA